MRFRYPGSPSHENLRHGCKIQIRHSPLEMRSGRDTSKSYMGPTAVGGMAVAKCHPKVNGSSSPAPATNDAARSSYGPIGHHQSRKCLPGWTRRVIVWTVPRIETVFPRVSSHIEQSESVRRIMSDGHDPSKIGFSKVGAGWRRGGISPRILRVPQSASSCVFPLRFQREPLSSPGSVGHCGEPADVNDRVISRPWRELVSLPILEIVAVVILRRNSLLLPLRAGSDKLLKLPVADFTSIHEKRSHRLLVARGLAFDHAPNLCAKMAILSCDFGFVRTHQVSSARDKHHPGRWLGSGIGQSGQKLRQASGDEGAARDIRNFSSHTCIGRFALQFSPDSR